jgi:hypothetical protein
VLPDFERAPTGAVTEDGPFGFGGPISDDWDVESYMAQMAEAYFSGDRSLVSDKPPRLLAGKVAEIAGVRLKRKWKRPARLEERAIELPQRYPRPRTEIPNDA